MIPYAKHDDEDHGSSVVDTPTVMCCFVLYFKTHVVSICSCIDAKTLLQNMGASLKN